VVMNLILGLVLFTIAYSVGVREHPARLGVVEAGSPAYEAGLRIGDEIVSIDGKPDANFIRLRVKVALSAANQVLHLDVKRPGVADLVKVDVVPKRPEKYDQPMIGINPCDSLTIYDAKPFIDPPGIDGPAPKKEAFPKDGGNVVEAGPAGGRLEPVDDIFALDRVLVANRNAPVDVMIESAAKGEKQSAPERSRVTLPVVRMVTFGLRMTTGPVASIQAGSIAEKAGFKLGDRIVSVVGLEALDPMHLPTDLFERAGKPTTFVVERSAEGKTSTVELMAAPDDSLPDVEPTLDPLDPLKIPGLGLAIEVEPKVAAVDKDSPAAKAGIAPGAVLSGMTIPPAKGATKGAKTQTLTFGKSTDKNVSEARWPHIFGYLQATERREMQVTLAGSSKPIAMTPMLDKSWSNPERGLNLDPIYRDLPPLPLGASIRRAADQTYDDVIGIYAMIRSLFSGRVSTKNLAGLPRIAEMSYHTAKMGWIALLQFLAMLSINLAVLNFLPIPPLDGGQIAFLVAEKVRGKPLPDSALTVLMVAGLVLVVVLMLFTILQDFYLMIFG
jgi:regulator of sigma E protease